MGKAVLVIDGHATQLGAANAVGVGAFAIETQILAWCVSEPVVQADNTKLRVMSVLAEVHVAVLLDESLIGTQMV